MTAETTAGIPTAGAVPVGTGAVTGGEVVTGGEACTVGMDGLDPVGAGLVGEKLASGAASEGSGEKVVRGVIEADD